MNLAQARSRYVVPPAYAERVRALAADIYPTEHRQCAQFLRHKATLIAPDTLRAHGIPVCTARQSEGTFVLVLSSAFHFGFNQGFNVAEAVNFALREWVPHGRRARACVCGDGQTPHVSVTSLLRAVKAAEPRAKDWWFFECRRARPATVVRAPSCPPCNPSQGPASSTRPAAPTPQ